MAELGYRDRYFIFEYIQTPSIDAYDASFREPAAHKGTPRPVIKLRLRQWQPNPAAH